MKALPTKEAVCRLLAATWDPQQLPAPDLIPWSEVLPLAERSNVGAVVYAVTRPMRDAMPPDVDVALQQAFFRSVADNTRCMRQLASVGAALSREGVPLLLLKGAALVPGLYAGTAPRLIGDIDIAVPREAVPACRQVLVDLGYTSARMEHRSGSNAAFGNQEPFAPPEPYQSVVDLHWHVLDVPYYLRKVPVGWFWQNTESLAIDGQSFQVLNPAANLVYLPAHLALHHRFCRLHPLFDLALLIVRRGEQLDWGRIVVTAKSFDLAVALRETLDRVAACWPSLALDEPRRRLHALDPSATDRRLFRLLAGESRSNTLDFYTTLVSVPSLAARARYAWANMFPQPAYMVGRYAIRARWQLPYWYLYRLVGGLLRFAANLPRALRIDRERKNG